MSTAEIRAAEGPAHPDPGRDASDRAGAGAGAVGVDRVEGGQVGANDADARAAGTHGAGTDLGSDTQSRLVVLVNKLARRRVRMQRFAELVDQLRRFQLVPVVGEEALRDELGQQLDAADEALQQLEHGRTGLGPALDQLAQAVSSPLWAAERQAIPRLSETLDSVREQTNAMSQRLASLQAEVADSWKELDEARAYGVVDPERQARTSALEGVVRQAHTDAGMNRFGRVALALTQADNIGDLAADDHLAERLRAARLRVGPVVKHSELVLISSLGPDEVLEYTALLRIPRSDVQRVDLAASSVLVVSDREALAGIVHRIAEVVGREVRSARSSGAERASPADGSGADGESGTRGFGVDGESGTRGFGADDGPVPVDGGPSLQLADVTDRLAEVGQLLYSLSLPDEMQRLLGDARGSLVVTTNDLELPWELLHDGEDFLCLQRPVARMPLGRTLPRRPHRCRNTSDGSKLRVLLVASDPYENLPGARREVEQVRERLADAYSDAVDIRCLIGPEATGRALNESLRSAAYHVVHYAGHADFDSERPERSRLLLHGEGSRRPEPYFAQKIERLLAGSPLVFLNACESSYTANVSPYIARETQGLASAFLYGGATACVGSLWPVFDDTAAEFAATFYQRLFEGLAVGEALRQARAAVRSSDHDTATWAAYALYGDPLFELPLHPRSAADRQRRPELQPVWR